MTAIAAKVEAVEGNISGTPASPVNLKMNLTEGLVPPVEGRCDTSWPSLEALALKNDTILQAHTSPMTSRTYQPPITTNKNTHQTFCL